MAIVNRRSSGSVQLQRDKFGTVERGDTRSHARQGGGRGNLARRLRGSTLLSIS